MTEQERLDWQNKKGWLTSDQAQAWSPEVRDCWLRMRRAYKAWKLTRTPPNPALTSFKESGQQRPTWVANDAYIAYMVAMEDWRAMEPAYINENRARMSAVDFEEENKPSHNVKNG